jgi:hypothetical protein
LPRSTKYPAGGSCSAFGGGWNAEEIEDHGTAFKTRFKLMRERIEAMKAIWTQSKPEYHGEFVNFPPMMTWPKPVQKPHPPIIVGDRRSAKKIPPLQLTPAYRAQLEFKGAVLCRGSEIAEVVVA